MNIVRDWFRRYFSDPQVVALALLLLGGVAAVLLLGHVLAPVIAGLVIAYVLDPSVQILTKRRVPHGLAVTLVFIGFSALILFGLLTMGASLSRGVRRTRSIHTVTARPRCSRGVSSGFSCSSSRRLPSGRAS